MDNESTFQSYLRDVLIGVLNTDKVKHSGRTLFEHLKGTHDLLRDWGNERHVCLAGLFHSIYGTDTFKHVSMTERSDLIKLIGVKAELLVHQFSQGNRPFFSNIDDRDMRRDLLELEAANLYEQGGNANVLRKLARMSELSNGARAALNCGAV